MQPLRRDGRDSALATGSTHRAADTLPSRLARSQGVCRPVRPTAGYLRPARNGPLSTSRHSQHARRPSAPQAGPPPASHPPQQVAGYLSSAHGRLAVPPPHKQDRRLRRIRHNKSPATSRPPTAGSLSLRRTAGPLPASHPPQWAAAHVPSARSRLAGASVPQRLSAFQPPTTGQGLPPGRPWQTGCPHPIRPSTADSSPLLTSHDPRYLQEWAPGPRVGGLLPGPGWSTSQALDRVRSWGTETGTRCGRGGGAVVSAVAAAPWRRRRGGGGKCCGG